MSAQTSQFDKLASPSFAQMNVNIGGVISVALFYCLILAVGIWVGWKQKRKFERMRVVSGANRSENIMLAGRDMGLFVGVLTMTGF